MNTDLLSKFTLFVKELTRAERFLSVDAGLNPVDVINLPQETLESPRFQEIIMPKLSQAMAAGKPIISNNIIDDDDEAPTTNTSFAQLRLVVVIPVGQYGAVYMDRLLSRGLIPREIVDKLARLAEHLVETNQDDFSEAQMMDFYQQSDGVDSFE